MCIVVKWLFLPVKLNHFYWYTYIELLCSDQSINLPSTLCVSVSDSSSLSLQLCPPPHHHHGLWSFIPQHGVWIPRLLQQVPGGVSGR